MKWPDWRGRTVVAIASGPSLTAADCARVRASGLPTIVTNTTFLTCPWADAVFTFDTDWQRHYRAELREFSGRIFSQHFSCRPPVECVRPWMRTFGNSGANAVSVAIAAGAARVLLLAFDCSTANGSHHHGDHPAGLRNCDTLPKWPEQFNRLAQYAERHGVAVVNVSRETALTCFPRGSLDDELDDLAAAGVSRPACARAGSVDAGIRADRRD